MNMNKEKVNLLKAYNMLLYFAGSMIMKEPTDECIYDFWTKGTLKNLPVKSSNPRFIKAASILRESCTDKDTCRVKLVRDFHRLFDKRGPRLAPACESEYLSSTDNTKGTGVSAGDYYRLYGWNPGQKFNVPYDHLGILLLFLTQLTDKLIILDDEPCTREMQNEIRRFIDLHILSWIPEWNEDMQLNAQSDCYKGIGNLIYASIEDISSILS